MRTLKNVFYKASSWKTFIIIILIFVTLECYIKWKWSNDKFQNTPFANGKIKKILLWNSFFGVRDAYFGFGTLPFFNHHCSEPYCYITDDRNWIDVDQFDAVVFHGPEYDPVEDNFPESRSPHQYYAYISMESPANRPVSSTLDGFFNLTMTHRIDSDITAYYWVFNDKNGRFISPSDHPQWVQVEMGHEKIERYKNDIKSKHKPVAWFVSNCHSKNHREDYVKKLQEHISVDIYGTCGPFQCPRNNESHCFHILKRDYYFYLSFENSFCKDYLTEKVMNAMNNGAVPIVYSGADLNKFLPPNSYIDATKFSPEDLAKKIEYLIQNPDEYVKYFWWKDFYVPSGQESFFCRLCQVLHDSERPRKSYKIHEWWHGTEDKPICKDTM